jgi:hypothetical protein
LNYTELRGYKFEGKLCLLEREQKLLNTTDLENVEALMSHNTITCFTFKCMYQVFLTASVVYWSECLATDPETRVRFSVLPEKKVVGLERGPPSLVSTTEGLLDRQVADPV